MKVQNRIIKIIGVIAILGSFAQAGVFWVYNAKIIRVVSTLSGNYLYLEAASSTEVTTCNRGVPGGQTQRVLWIPNDKMFSTLLAAAAQGKTIRATGINDAGSVHDVTYYTTTPCEIGYVDFVY